MERGPYERLPHTAVKRIEDEWAANAPISTREVHKLLEKKHWHYKLRSVQRVIAKAKARAGPIPHDPQIVPWGEGWPTEAEGIHFVFACLAINRAFGDAFPPLTIRQAKWLLRLRVIFDPRQCVPRPGQSADDMVTNVVATAWLTARAYATEERLAMMFHRPIDAAALDAYVLYRPWQSAEQNQVYQADAEAGVIPSPLWFDALADVIGDWNPEVNVEAMKQRNKQEVSANERQPTPKGQGKLDDHARATAGPGHGQAPPAI